MVHIVHYTYDQPPDKDIHMIIIGHRGARGLAPENTLASIRKALACGVDEVEIDIRITSDGVPVLSHDKAVANEESVMEIASHTFEALRSFKPDITTLSEALKAVAGRATLYIEVKRGEPTAPIAEAIRRHTRLSRQTPSLLLASKSQRTLMELHSELPDTPTLVIEPWSGLIAVYRARKVGTKRISMRSWWLWKGFLERMQKRGYLITPYTVNKPHKIAKWQPYIYGVVTDFPNKFTGKE